eukprot:12834676-Prorocentrum_lima.AAC.1
MHLALPVCRVPCELGKDFVSLLLPKPGTLSQSIYCSSDLPHCSRSNNSQYCQYVWDTYQHDCILVDGCIEKCAGNVSRG